MGATVSLLLSYPPDLLMKESSGRQACHPIFIASFFAAHVQVCARQWGVCPCSKGHTRVRIFPRSTSHGYSRTRLLF